MKIVAANAYIMFSCFLHLKIYSQVVRNPNILREFMQTAKMLRMHMQCTIQTNFQNLWKTPKSILT